MKISRALAISKKEIFHIFRDPFTMALALGMPVIMVLFFGYAIEFNMNRIMLAIYDSDKTQSSHLFQDIFVSSDYFRGKNVVNPTAALKAIEEGGARAGLLIEKNFERDLQSTDGAQVQILVDGTDNASAGSILGYLGGLQKIAQSRLAENKKPTTAFELRTRYLYNPELNSRWFVVPGLAAVIMAILSILLTSLTVAREWENGSMELLLATPVQPLEIIIGKLLPYCLLGLGAVAFVFVTALVVFQVPFRGSFILYMVTCVIFLLTYLAQGLLISVLTRKQQLSMQFAMLSGLLPTILLSGFIFPNEHMPSFFYYLTMILPARWFIFISRGIFLKGAGIAEVQGPFLMLCLLLVVMITLAVKKFKKDVEP
ncbi:Inner membrane transport permease YbhS [compost metagenome]